MTLHPLRARRERRRQARRELHAFLAVRRTAHEELRELTRHATDAARPTHTLEAARAALEATSTAAEVVAVEPYVRAARAALGVVEPQGRRSYQDVVEAAQEDVSIVSPERRAITARELADLPDQRDVPRFEIGG